MSRHRRTALAAGIASLAMLVASAGATAAVAAETPQSAPAIAPAAVTQRRLTPRRNVTPLQI